MLQHEDGEEPVVPSEVLHLFGREFIYVDGVSPGKIVAFLERVEFAESGCWIWMAGKYNQGNYGAFYWNNRNIPAHRFSWIAFRGIIEPGNQIHHKCVQPNCVNPDHLQSVTPAEHLLEHTPSNPVYQQSRITSCGHGHPLSGDNLYLQRDSSGHVHRRCRRCRADWAVAKYRRTHTGPRKTEPTHCHNGHPLTPENTYEWIGIKYCRPCHNAVSTKSYRKLHPPKPPKPPKTHCVNGHPWIPENLYTMPNPLASGLPEYKCAICHRESRNKAYQDRKARYGKV